MEQLHWFIDPIKHKYADFTGRATRQEFWMFVLFSFIINLALELVSLDTISVLFSLAIFVPSLAIGARRLHDIKKSGWWQLIGIIPILGWILLIVWFAQQGETGDNEYGADPRSATDTGAAMGTTSATTPSSESEPTNTPST